MIAGDDSELSCLTFVNRATLSQNRVIVVCSARSTGKKAEGTTSRQVSITFFFAEEE